MPSHDLMLRFQEHLVVQDRWARLRHALQQDAARLAGAAGRQLARRRSRCSSAALGRREARRQLAAWRLFMISTAEIWGYHDGDEWLVATTCWHRAASLGKCLLSYAVLDAPGKGINVSKHIRICWS